MAKKAFFIFILVLLILHPFCEASLESGRISLGDFEAPSEFVSLREVHRGSGGVVLIHIQDPHANFSGQENLSKGLDAILGRYGISLVLVEGGSIEGTLTPLKELGSEKTIRRVARSFFLQGKLHGEEYLNLTSDHPMRIIGIEEETLYEESVQVYAKLAKNREEILNELKRIGYAVDKLKRRHYPGEILEYEKKVEGRRPKAEGKEEEKLETLVFLARNEQISLKAYPEVRKMMGLKRKRNANRRVFQTLKFDRFLEEEENLEEKVYSAALQDPDAMRLRSMDLYLKRLLRAYQIQLSSTDFERLKAFEKEFSLEWVMGWVNRKLAENDYFEDLVPYSPLLDASREDLRRFYDLVRQRDLAFMRNIEEVLKRENQTAAVLITGGYHTEHLTRLMREKNYSYAVLTPHVTSETSQKKYEKLLLEPVRNPRKSTRKSLH